MKKLWPDADAALDGLVKDGMLLAIGGFGLCGVPEALIDAVERGGARGLTVVSTISAWASCWRRGRFAR